MGGFFFFRSYVCSINTVIKGGPSVGDGGGGSDPGNGRLCPAGPGQRGGRKALQPIRLSGRTDPTFFNLHSAGAIHRDLGEAEATGRRKRGQPGSHAKLLPGSKALLDSEKQFSFHLSFDP